MSKPRQHSLRPISPSAKNNGRVTSSPATPPQIPAARPAPDDREAWKAYWQAQGQPWRTEPEIDTKRQDELAQRRSIVPDIERGIYPFKAMKLSRADAEWLLATHDNGRGPVDWSDEQERKREGLDLRGADLSQAYLQHLPLTRLHGGLKVDEWRKAAQEQRAMAAILMEGANLSGAQLESADLSGAQLEDADLNQAWLENADLIKAKLGGASFCGAHLEGACFMGAQLGNKQRIGPRLADAQWGNANLSVVEWSQFTQLGDEWEAHQKRKRDGKKKTEETRFDGYRAALRANRQLAVALRNQGLNDEADHFAYRAQLLQRVVWRYQHKWLKCIFSWLLFLIAGYGYRPSRSFLSYLLVITGFATAYYLLGYSVGPTLSPLGAFVFSMTSFHGRGFFPGNNISLDDPLTVLAAFEALVGLIIEVMFIATLTQRFFNR